MTDIKISYTTSDYLYTLAPEKIPSHETCETTYSVVFDSSCSFSPMNNDIASCGDPQSPGFKECLTRIDKEKGTNYQEEYTRFIDLSNNCYMAALCKNRKYAEKIQEQQTRHLGTNETYKNVKSILANEQWKTIHLGLGIFGMIAGIYILNNKTQ